MKKYIFLLGLALILSGCTTLDYNRAMGITYPAICPICKNNIYVYDTTSNYQCSYCKNTISAPEAIRLYQKYANVPSDIVTCPHCYTNQELRFLDNPSAQVIKCYYCQKDFDRAEGKKLYNIRLSESSPTQGISQININIPDSSSSDGIRNIYKRDRKDPMDYYRQVNPPGSWTNPIHTKEKK